jgi:hypothetical protein
MTSDSLTDSIERLLKFGNISGDIKSIDILTGGKNNQTYSVCLKSREKFVVKKYFQHCNDLRDRQSSESLFLNYAGQVAKCYVPKIYASDKSSCLSLIEFIAGTSINMESVKRREIATAISFINELNKASSKSQSVFMKEASEACFSMEDHINRVDGRVNALYQVLRDELNSEPSLFIRKLANFWDQLKNDIFRKAQAYGLKLNLNLPIEDRCISPSDFGFHNAIRAENTSIKFIDFEYAGWDDPAKLVGDFFNQVAVPVPKKHFIYFVESISNNFSDSQSFKKRAELLMPVYQVKWCCIVLNIYLSTDLRRRLFSDSFINVQKLKNEQLSKAKILFSKLDRETNELH